MNSDALGHILFILPSPSKYPVSRAKQPSSGEPNVKGVAFRSVLAVLQELRGEEGVEAVIESLPRDQAEMLRYTIVNTGWYPISIYRALWAAILRETGESYAIARAIGAASVRRDIKGVYRMLFRALSADTAFTLSSKLFSSYYDAGSVTVEERRKGQALAVYEGCVGFDRTMYEELAGSGEEILRLSGAKDVRMTIVRGGQDGNPACEMLLEWE
ncbi:MAG: hypothetical protein H5U40_01605 [Polyangiaceae bacterium]|nr:hypothetical protein [Polyangiaceae bacterium]